MSNKTDPVKAKIAELIPSVRECDCEATELNPEAWWDRYIADPRFRLEQELEAYRVQWAFIKTEVKDRNYRYKILLHLAGELSGPTYGGLISKAEALKQIDL